jgi:glyoxylase-like metal-dependent hydrolase (beta-lactamase superfamily II)
MAGRDPTGCDDRLVTDGDRLPDGILRVRADNPSPLTLDGTNSYVVDGWVVDPGPDDPAHLDALVKAAGGAVAGIVLTHDHSDHSEGAEPLAERTGAAVVRPRGGEHPGPFEAIGTPGHAPDHVALLAGRALFTGDTVLGTGSVFIMPGEGSLSAYLDSLRRLRELDVDALLPGHGPAVWDPRAKLDEYIEHRLDRERRVLEALAAGARTRDDLLDSAWSDVDFAPQPYLRYAAAATLEAHLEKLDEEGRLPDGVERGLG